ncbi:ammonium transporter, Amt family [Mytilus galloprovincialis]|nr:ammonium transporter, Amt family [Mytilus galloprovincialis]
MVNQPLLDVLAQLSNTTSTEVSLALSVESRKGIQIISIIFMILSQGGFGLLYSGLSRARNALTPYIAVFINMFIVLFCVWGVGYTFAWMSGNKFIGHRRKWFGSEMVSTDYIPWALHACYTMFVANIACGGILERGRPITYFVLSMFLAFFIHPVVVHWAWDEEGWLQTVHLRDKTDVVFKDIGGSCVIHVAGGISGFVGALLCRPRQERTRKVSAFKILHSHSAPMTGFGGIVIYCGLITLQLTRVIATNSQANSDLIAIAIINNFLASLGSSFVVLLLAWALNNLNQSSSKSKFHWPMIQAVVNAALVGSVSVAAGCDSYYPYISFVVGLIGGLVYMFYSFVVYLCMVDDPAETFAVHFGPGFWGVLAAAIFSRTYGAAYQTKVNGTYEETPYLIFAWNLIGAIVITAWCFVLVLIILLIVLLSGKLRVKKDIECEGVDADAFQEFAYPIEAWKRAPFEEKFQMQDDVSDISEKPSMPQTDHNHDCCRYCPEHDDRYRPLPPYCPEHDDRPRSQPPRYWPEHYFNSYRPNYFMAPRAKLVRPPYGSIYKI